MKHTDLYAIKFGLKVINLLLVPYGYYLNNKLRKLPLNSVVKAHGIMGPAVKIKIKRKCKIGLNSAIGTFIISHIYGDGITLTQLKQRWLSACIPLGLGVESFSDDVWLVEFERCDKE